MVTSEHILDLLGDEEPCPYLDGLTSRMQYKLIGNCTPETYANLLEHGWRRFGRVFFRPVCATCKECRSLRVDVGAFTVSRSMRRCWRVNRDLEVRLGRPRVTEERLALFERYHRSQTERKGWESRPATATSYRQGFVEGFESFGHELTFRDGERLVAVALLDRLPEAISAVYCYYDPDAKKRGLGVYSLLHHFSLATRTRVPWVYLGYWVEANPSLAYKARYRPHRVLEGRPDLDAAPVWSAPLVD